MIEKVTKYQNLIKVVHRAYCDDCKVELQPGNYTYMTHPPIYQYICPLCQKDYTSRISYPLVEFIGDRIIENEPDEE